MKISASLFCLVSTAILATAAPESPAKAVKFSVHSGYFVSNKFESDVATSFALIEVQAGFDKIFGADRIAVTLALIPRITSRKAG